jgi:hypothetical protein
MAIVAAVALLLACPSATSAGEQYALLVAVQQYDKAELTSLQFTENDITALADVLRDNGYSEENIVLMTQTRGAQEARYAPFARNIKKELELLLREPTKDDTVLLAFSGHGIQFVGDKEAYFCAADARLADRETLVSLGAVYQALAACEASAKVLLVDACRNDPQSNVSKAAGEVELEPVGRRGAPIAPPGGIAALFSCSAGEKSYEAPELKHGVFFHYVVEGLAGQADLDHDQEVSLAELQQYTVKNVQRYARRELGQPQTPERTGEDRGLTLAKVAGWEPLFNGRDLTGWVADGGGREAWSIANGELIVRAGDERNIKHWLRTQREYGDYALRLEYRFSAGGNSGVALRMKPGDHPLEVQLQDDSFPRHAAQKRECWTGSLFNLAIDRPAKLRPIGQWNDVLIEVRGPTVRVTINGDRVPQTSRDRLPADSIEAPELDRARGHIALQKYTGEVRFRNIQVRELR